MDSADVKTTIMAAAIKEFAAKGYQAASLSEIAKTANVANSLINYHFQNKEGLFNFCLQTFTRKKSETLISLLSDVNSAEELRVRLDLFANEMIRNHLEDPCAFEIIHREMHSDNPLIEQFFRDTIQKSFMQVVDFFSKAQQKGILKPDLNPLIIAGLWFGCLSDTIRNDGLRKKLFGASIEQPKFRQQFVQNLLTIFLSGVTLKDERG